MLNQLVKNSLGKEMQFFDKDGLGEFKFKVHYNRQKAKPNPKVFQHACLLETNSSDETRGGIVLYSFKL